MVKIALICHPPTGDSWYIKVEDASDALSAIAITEKLNRELNRYKRDEVIAVTALGRSKYGVKASYPNVDLDTLYKVLKGCGYILRTTFKSPYWIGRRFSMFNFLIKNVPTVFVNIKDKEINARKLLSTLYDFDNDDEINDYDLDTSIADILVDMGVLEKYVGSRMAILYRKTDKFEEFFDSYIDEYCKFEKENHIK